MLKIMVVNELAKKLLLGYELQKNYYENGQIKTSIWFRNKHFDGEVKVWYSNGKLEHHSWFKEGRAMGEYKSWGKSGKIDDHHWMENDLPRDFPKDVKIKEGYILGGDGKYYKDN